MTPDRQALPPSLYAETARPAVPTPPLDGDRRVSVAIIGGGITGLSAALHLAEQSVDVAVLEANEPGWGASGRNGGHVNPGLKHDPDQVEADFGPDLGARMVAMSGAAPDAVFDLIRRHQIVCEAHQSGTLRAAFHARNAAALRTSAAQHARRNHPVDLLERADTEGATGTRRYLAALLDRRGGRLNPLGYTRGLTQAAMQAGATIHGGTRATAIRRQGAHWAVQTPTGTVRAGKLILGTNGYTDDLWPRLRRSIVPVFSGIAATEPLSDALAARVLPARSVLYELGQITVYYRLDQSNRLVIGGRSRMRELHGPQDLQFLTNYARRLWPDLRDTRWTHGWSGQLAMTPDHYPHIHEPADGVLVCLGYNGRGVALSTAMGPQLARRTLGGRTTEIDMPITGIAPIPFHALWRSAVAARMVYGRIADHLHL